MKKNKKGEWKSIQIFFFSQKRTQDLWVVSKEMKLKRTRVFELKPTSIHRHKPNKMGKKPKTWKMRNKKSKEKTHHSETENTRRSESSHRRHLLLLSISSKKSLSLISLSFKKSLSLISFIMGLINEWKVFLNDSVKVSQFTLLWVTFKVRIIY